jgi:Arm DNA-binding domain
MAQRQRDRLSPAFVRKTSKLGMHPDGGGLYLQCSPTQDGKVSNKSWIFRFAWGGKERKMGLGPLADVGLAEAREQADKCRRLLREHVDPIARRHAERAAAKVEDAKALSFEQAGDRYIAAHRAGWDNVKHAAQWRNTLADY